METGAFISEDGTEIGYRIIGAGPGAVLLHGAMQSSHSFMTLGSVLANRFTVYIPDRRGRGLSGPFNPGYSLQTEVDDLRRLIDRTGARNIFGLSSGALIALETALSEREISRLALYEPPLDVGRSPSPWHACTATKRKWRKGILPPPWSQS
jgi:pimeloyl-ACP methyl ester carboxylesterase